MFLWVMSGMGNAFIVIDAWSLGSGPGRSRCLVPGDACRSRGGGTILVARCAQLCGSVYPSLNLWSAHLSGSIHLYKAEIRCRQLYMAMDFYWL